MRWHLTLKEFRHELIYIKGENNAVADALYRLEMSDNHNILNIYEIYNYDEADLPDSVYPIFYQYIAKSQRTYTKLKQKMFSHKEYTLNTFCGGDKDHSLIFRNKKICLPAALQKKTVYWYHDMLCHPVETRTDNKLRQKFDWKGLHTTVHDVCKKCPTCQRTKTTN